MKYNFKSNIFRLLFLIFAGHLLVPPPCVRAMALSDAVSNALNTNPKIEALNYKSAAVRSRIGQAYAGYLPTLDARLAGGFENTENRSTRIRTGDDADLNPTESGLKLKQNIFEGFKTTHAVKSAKARARATAREVQSASETLGFQAINAYLNVLQFEKLVILSEKNVASHRSLLDLVSQRVAQQVASRAEANQARARVKAAEASLFRARGSLADAHAAYKTIIGVLPRDLTDPEIPQTVIHDYTKGIKTALKHNPRIALAQEQIERARSEVKIAKAPFWPRLNLEFSVDRDRDLSGTPGDDDSESVMLGITQNIFSGGLDLQKKYEAMHLLNQAKSELKSSKRDVTETVKVAYNARDIALSRQKAFETQVMENEKVKKAFFQQYTVNKRTLLDLLDAENELFVSESNYIIEKYNLKLSAYRILTSQGILLKTLGIPFPKGGRTVNMTLKNSLPLI